MKVFVWNNSWGPAAFKHPGHAALAINGTDTPEHYISYWPDGPNLGKKKGRHVYNNIPIGDFTKEMAWDTRVNLMNKKWTPREGQTKDLNIHVGGYNIPNQHRQWVQLPNTIIDLPEADPENGVIGLDLETIIAWWKIVKMDLGNYRYKFVSNKLNCSSIVMSALFAGGAKTFCSPPHGWIYYHPNDVADYARKLNDKIARLQIASDEVNRAAMRDYSFARDRRSFDMDIAPPPKMSELPTVAQWKKNSFVRFGRRKEQVAKMDTILGQYWDLGQDWDETNTPQKGIQLLNLITQIAEHLRMKPKSDRRKAVLNLGVQVIRVIQDRAASSRDTREHLELIVKELM